MNQGVSAIVLTDDESVSRLEWSLSSLADQTHPPDEVVLIDNTTGGVRSPSSWDGDYQAIRARRVSDDQLIKSAISNIRNDRAILLDRNPVLVGSDHIQQLHYRHRSVGSAVVGSPTVTVKDDLLAQAEDIAGRLSPRMFRGDVYLFDTAAVRGEGDTAVLDDLRRSGPLVVHNNTVAIRGTQADDGSSGRQQLFGIVAAAALGGVGSAIGTAAIDWLRSEV